MSRPVPDLVRQWADARIGHAMSLKADEAAARHRHGGKVVDWKADAVGMGVFFVVDRGPRTRDGHRYREVYRVLPPDVAAAVGAPRPLRAHDR